MNYKQFYTKVSNSKETFISFGKTAHFQNGKLTLEGVEVDQNFDCLEEAKEYCKTLQLSEKIETKIVSEVYENIPVAEIIKEYHNIRVTDTLIESYKELVSSKLFTVDPVVSKIKSLNKFDTVLEGRLDYKLSDGSTVVVTNQMQEILNNLLGNQKELVDYMRESKENFLHVLEEIVEE